MSFSPLCRHTVLKLAFLWQLEQEEVLPAGSDLTVRPPALTLIQRTTELERKKSQAEDQANESTEDYYEAKNRVSSEHVLPSTVFTGAKEPPPDETCREMALRILMQAKVACSNSIHNLETLDGMTDMWTENGDALESEALDAHLRCEYAAKECRALITIIDAFFANAAVQDQMFRLEELGIRVENALAEVKAVLETVEKVAAGGGEAADGSTELRRRCARITTTLEEVQQRVERLKEMHGGGQVQAQ